jgi:dynein heavy chain
LHDGKRIKQVNPDQLVQTARENEARGDALIAAMYQSANSVNRPSILNTVKRPRGELDDTCKKVKYQHMPPPPPKREMDTDTLKDLLEAPQRRAPRPPLRRTPDGVVTPRASPVNLPALEGSQPSTPLNKLMDEPLHRIPVPPSGTSNGKPRTPPGRRSDDRDSNGKNGAVIPANSPFAFIEKVKRMAKEGTQPKEFIYLSIVPPAAMDLYNPYNLVQKSHSQIDPANHFIMSAGGVTHYSGGAVYASSLDQWEREHNIFHAIFEIPFFQKFRRWKTFYYWKRHVRTTTVQKYKDFLEDNLYILDSNLCPRLLQVRKLCLDVREVPMYRSKHQTETLEKYVQIQSNQRDKSLRELKRMHEEIQDLVLDACRASMKPQEAEPVDEDEEMADAELLSQAKGGSLSGPKSGVGKGRNFHPAALLSMHPQDEPFVPTYTELSQKRAECRRLTNFIRLADYMLIDSLVMNANSAIQGIADVLLYPKPETEGARERRLAKEAAAKEWQQLQIDAKKDKEKAKELAARIAAKEEEEKKKLKAKLKKQEEEGTLGQEEEEEEEEVDPDDKDPIFMTEILFQDDDLQILPREDNVAQEVSNVVQGFFDNIGAIQRFMQMVVFSEYTEPVIAETSDERDFGQGPDVVLMVTGEEECRENQRIINESLELAFQDVVTYTKTYDPFKDIYIENTKLDTDEVKSKGYSLEWFKDQMDLYKKQHADMGKIRNKKRVGLYWVQTKTLKQFFMPNPLNCLQALHNLLPILAREMNSKLLDELADAVKRLNSEPSSVEEFVDFVKFHTKVTTRMETLEVEFENVKDIYNLMEQEEIPVAQEDHMAYLAGTMPNFQKLRGCIQVADDSKDLQVRTFSGEIDRRMDILRDNLQDISKRGQHEMIGSEESNMTEVIEYVTGLQNEITDISTKEDTYADYQELFGLEVTKIEEAYEIQVDIGNKVKLWTALKDWLSNSETWNGTVFHEIDPDSLNMEVTRFAKTVGQVTRGLPDNAVVQKLKGMVDEFKATLPVIQAMRNPVLQKHHFTAIDEILGRDLSQEPEFTLGVLMDLKVVDKMEEIQNVSNGATQEAALEDLLAKVQKVWGGGGEVRPVEFIVNPYKETKDVYTLGSVEDIVTQLEDSGVIVSTVVSSRFCTGALKARAEKWEEDIKYINDTLDKWLEFQRSWMYLESIFGSAEIARQWPQDAKVFSAVDKQFKDIMKRVFENPSVYRTMIGGLNPQEKFDNGNKQLERILSNLEKKLEEKRRYFPRFYFLSNDDLLDILSQIKNPRAVQPHLLKMFDNIKKLEFGENNVDVIAIESAEGESIPLAKYPKARGEVEKWLSVLEQYMVLSLRRLAKTAVMDYEGKKRTDWIFDHPCQLVLTVSQIYWCREVAASLASEDGAQGLRDYQQECYRNLGDLADLTARKLNKIERRMLGTLITTDVHSRDLVDQMVDENVSGPTQFGWQKQLRTEWEVNGGPEGGEVVLRQNNSYFGYGYEYQGAQPRLVITPLTDRIYMTVTGALRLCLGAAPSGPAGTGKTETVKDMAKCLAFQCIVYNCSDGVTYKMMEKFISGLAQCGAWCCLDEFNRINIEVLSVIASQVSEVRQALLAKVDKFTFQGVPDVDIKPNFGAFITMNPGYAGRTELPDNLKVLFRPVAVMTPDFRMIAEVILFSEGYKAARPLSLKITQLFKLSSEQLSPQDHYDFGMRALKSILVMAGGLKRGNPHLTEEVSLIRACRDANIPKFVAPDIPLFNGILADLFPGIELPSHDYGELQSAINLMIDNGLFQHVSTFNLKITQLYETLVVRHGVMLVGATGSGKTVNRDVMKGALTYLREQESENQFAQKVQQYSMNPKSITYGELYGEMNLFTGEWKDGVCAIIAKICVADTTPDMKWILFDGPVDTLWIESMNSVLDDSKLLCLDNGVRIKLPDTVRMMFEVMDLSVASPATTSRCGMVFMNPEELGWMPPCTTWMNAELAPYISPEGRTLLDELFLLIQKGLDFLRKECKMMVQTVEANLTASLCDLFLALVKSHEIDLINQDPTIVAETIKLVFAFSYVWSIGGNVNQASQEKFDNYAREALESCAFFPPFGMVFDFQMDLAARKFIPWEQSVPDYKYIPEEPFFQILVPTIDTVRYSYIIKTLVQVRKPCLLNGVSGTGKSVIMNAALFDSVDDLNLQIIGLQFSAQTSSARTQESLEAKLKVKRKNLLGAPQGKTVVVFVDDLNMPAVEQFGAQPPIELLRQMLGMGGFYDRKQLFWKDVKDVTLTAACGPPEGGRSPTTPRMVRFFHLMFIPELTEETLRKIYSSILGGFLGNFPADVKNMTKQLVNSTCEIYMRIKDEMRPRPSKAHYTFNLRDCSKVFQGMMQVTTRSCGSPGTAMRLWISENMRCFYDRLVDDTDRDYFTEELMMDVLRRNFNVTQSHDDFFRGSPILFGDFLRFGAPPEQRMYEEISDPNRLTRLFEEYLDEYNMTTSKQMSLVFFKDHCEHLTRIVRVIRQPRGNALLVGVGGSGKQSLTRVAAAIQDCKCFQIEVAKNYNIQSFRADLGSLYTKAGVENTPVVFLFADNQIVDETMLEDINNMLNTGEVPNLYAPEDKEKTINACTEPARAAGQGDTRDSVYQFFIGRVRDNLHIVLCMSPVGDNFRRWCRQFPSLVNCCTIDWFDKWPQEALLAVAKRLMEEVDLGDANQRAAITETCVDVHMIVGVMAERFYTELRRYFYVTPTSYLEFISLYMCLLEEKRTEANIAIGRIKNGNTKMVETNQQVDVMQTQLTAMQPKLQEARTNTEALMADLSVRKTKAEGVRGEVKVTASQAAEAQKVASAIAADAQADLDQAMPELESALKSLDSLNKGDIGEIRGYTNVPKAVALTVSAVMTVLNEKKLDWDYAKKEVLADPKFIQRLKDFDKDNIPPNVVTKMQKYIQDPEFTPDKVQSGGSAACKSLCMWVRAIDLYSRVSKTVAPKKAALADAQAKLDAMNKTLKDANSKLSAIENELASLQATFDKSLKEKDDLEYNIDLSSKRLTAASALTGSLADKVVQWDILVKEMEETNKTLAGDVFVSSACVAYLGAFTAPFRLEMVTKWVDLCRERGMVVSDPFSLVKTLATPVQMREWAIMTLPTDQMSLENAIMVSICTTPKSKRWPMMIDPQGQALKWISRMEAKSGLKTIKLSDQGYIRTLEQAIRNGTPVIIKDVGETLDPALEPILLKQVYTANGRTLINLGGPDNAIDYDPAFRFYITTKIANPKYLPDVCIKVTIVNFTVTMQGLEEQMLGDVVAIEKAELEETKNKIIQSVANDKKKLKQYEDGILEDLESASGNILDNQKVIDSLKKAQSTSELLSKRLKDAEVQSASIDVARLEYVPVATRASILYFVIADLAMIDPMYQYSLDYFKVMFAKVVQDTEPHDDFQHHLQVLIKNITAAVYTNICGGLFKKDKTIFSFMIAIQVKRQNGSITDNEWQYLLRSGAFVNPEDEENCPMPWLTGAKWALLCALEKTVPAFAGLTNDIKARPKVWQAWIESRVYSNTLPLPGPDIGDGAPEDHCSDAPDANWDEAKPILESLGMSTAARPGREELEKAMLELSKVGRFDDGFKLCKLMCPPDTGAKWANLSQMQRMIIIKVCRMPDLLFSVTEFVKWDLGPHFIDPPAFSIENSTKDANSTTPIIFILSPGADPFTLLLDFAQSRGFRERMHVVSLGQGQGETAKRALDTGRKNGDWVILQNCHLSKSFMPELEKIIANFGSHTAGPMNPTFRLWLTSMPSSFFPIPILQNSIKLTNENPTGIRANMLRCYNDIKDIDLFDKEVSFPECTKENAYHKLLFGLCLFHSIISERKKFGPLGWNIKYEFGDIDLSFGSQWLFMFLDEQNTVPWDALIYVIGQIVYGGRVTDPWDRRALLSILSNFFRPEMLQDEYKMSASGIYTVPLLGDLEHYKDFIRTLPIHDHPEIFGMHENANIAFQLQECEILLNTVLSVQPRAAGKSSGDSGPTPEEMVQQKVIEFESTIPAILDIEEESGPNTWRTMPNGLPYSLCTVLNHEIEKFNKLLKAMYQTLTELQKALKGLTVLSEDLDAMFNSFLNNQVPMLWEKKAYPSLKPLGSWYKDLLERVAFTRKWLRKGEPPAFWMSGMFYPHGFMTGTLQAYARQTGTSVDVLGFKFTIMEMPAEEIDKSPEAGVYVYGLFMDSCLWNKEKWVIEDSLPGVPYAQLPVVHFLPEKHHKKPDTYYAAPLYKTTVRKGNLSSLGQSTNFVLAVEVPSDMSEDYWVQKGAALVCALND